MNKYLKYLLWTLAGAIVLVGGAIAYIAATFNPNDYKPQIIQAVKEQKQRTLKLDGDIKLTFFPRIGASIGKLSLSEYQSEREFASVDRVQVALALLPLLSKQVVVDQVTISGAKVQLVKYKNGKLNIDDLAGAPAPAQKNETQAAASSPVKLDIAGIKVEQAELVYRDEALGSQYSVKQLTLETGRLTNGVPAKVTLSAQVQASQPKLDMAADLKTTLTFDLEKNRYQVQGLNLQLNGNVLDISGLAAKVSGDASADLATQEFTAKNFAAEVQGNKAGDAFEAKLDAPSLTLTKDKYAASKLVLDAKLNGAPGNIAASLVIPGIEGNAQSFKVSTLTLDVDAKQAEQAFKLKLATPITGSLEAKQVNLSSLVLALNATGDKLPNKSVSSELKGSAQIDAGRQSVRVKLEGGLLQSKAKLELAVNNFSHPAIRYDVALDQFDLDSYLPKKAAEPAQAKQAAPEQPFDLSALKTLNLEGSVRIGALKAFNVKATQLRVDVKARDGVVNVSPLSANLYQGSMGGNISINAASATPVFSVNETLSGVNIGPLVTDAVDLDVAEGKGNVAIKVATQGNTVTALKKALNGTLGINLENGAIKGIDIAKLINQMQSLNKNSSVQSLKPNKDDKTAFSEFKANFKINNGVAHNDDLMVKSQVLKISGNGDIDVGNDRMDYNAKATMYKNESGGSGTLPVRLSGPFTELKYDVDFAALVADVAKQKLDAKKEEVVNKAREDAKARAQEELKKGLKGLFGR